MSTNWQTLKNLARHTLDTAVAMAAPGPVRLAEMQKKTADIAVVSDPDLVERLAQGVGYATIRGGDLSGVPDFTAKVLKQAQGRPIRSLFVGAHGGPGQQNVGQYYKYFSGGNAATIDVDHFDLQLSQLAPLTSHFAKNAVVTMGGCNTAEGPKGQAFLGHLAALWKVTVQGSEDIQGPEQGLEGTNIVVCRANPKLSDGYSCSKQKNEVIPPGDGAGGLQFGSPWRIVSDIIQLGQSTLKTIDPNLDI